jgi:oxygen-dependent protoporphyrinogen oxidase
LIAMGCTEKVVIVGAGISGLACAFRLKQLGCPCPVLEAKDRVGGVIASVRRNGFLFELGPQFPRFPRPLWRLVCELGLENEFLAGNRKAKRYILYHGTLHPAVFSPGALLATRLVSTTSKLRILTEVFRSTEPPLEEESLADFVERKFGKDVVENLVDPVVSTVFFGDARKMGMEGAFSLLAEWERKHGSVVRGALRTRNPKSAQAASLKLTDALPSLGSFQNGMGSLPEALARSLPDVVKCKAQVASLALAKGEMTGEDEGWQIVLTNGETMRANHVVLALPAYEAARLLEIASPQLAERLSAIEYAPVCVVSTAYSRSQISHPLDGFGFMVPRQEKLHTICTFWNSSLFPQHAPKGKVLLTSFAGREFRDGAHHLEGESYERSVIAENAKILGISGAPLDREIWRHPRALPQYNVGHARRVTEIDQLLSQLPNLHLAGNYRKGRSLGDCVALADEIAARVQTQMQRSNI